MPIPDTIRADTDDLTEAGESDARQGLLDEGHHLPAPGSNRNEVSIRVDSLKADVTGLAMHQGVASVLLGDDHDPSTMLSTFVGNRRNPLHRSSLSTALLGADQRNSSPSTT
jgi:hypothetical protein